MKLSIKLKLMIGFGFVLTLMVMVSINTYLQAQQLSHDQHHLSEIGLPSVEAAKDLSNGVNLSLAALRGYMILGKDENKAQLFKKQRLQSWQNIDASIEKLMLLSENWQDEKIKQAIKKVKTDAALLKSAQNEIEEISHHKDNIESLNILLNNAAPEAKKVVLAITRLINLEASQKATAERKKMFKVLADSRGSFALGLANIRAYLLSGNIKFKLLFDQQLKTNNQAFTYLNKNQHLFKSAQLKAWQEYKSARKQFIKWPSEMFASRQADDWNKANSWLASKAAPKAIAIQKAVKLIEDIQHTSMKHDQELFENNLDQLRSVLILTTLLALGCGLAIALWLSGRIVNPLKLLVRRVKDVAAGELAGADLVINTGDELSELSAATNQMTADLRSLIIEITHSIDKLSASSDSMTSCAASTSTGMQEQQAVTEQVATAMEEMTTTVQNVALSAQQASQVTNNANSEADESRRIVDENLTCINQLASVIEKASSSIHALGDDTSGVDEILQVISGIAEQTNLLALNAAIEAARAGEQGRGFAVVADEVRTLAGRTQESTSEIRGLLDRLKNGAQNAIQAMDEGQQQTLLSVDNAKHTASSLNNISDAVTSINDLNTQIAEAADQQHQVTEIMNQDISLIRDKARLASVDTTKTEQSADAVSEQTQKLNTLIGRFKVAS